MQNFLTRYKAILFISMLVAPGTNYSAETQHIKNHPSPYVAMHAEDKVNWRVWNAATLQDAKRHDKPLFLSVGYFSCYWCHVMQREAFNNKAIAEILNRDFIPVIVDRELHPALDAYLVAFMEKYAGQSGWPLQAVLTPEALPAIGTLYMPPQKFEAWLQQVNDLWQNDKVLFRNSAKQAAKELTVNTAEQRPLTQNVIATSQTNFIRFALENADELEGGFGNQSKFPLPATLGSLISLYEQNQLSELGQFLQLTLDKIATQGLRDHLSGGFFRYTVDPGWQEPHFEKMLYDNAQLALLYLHAARTFNSEFYQNIAYNTLDFLLETMSIENGFVSSLSAIDDTGNEGSFYLWSREDLERLLTEEEKRLISRLWQLNTPSHFATGYLPRFGLDIKQMAIQSDISEENASILFNSATEKLLQEQKKRDIPKDSKRIAAWNGLALWAFSEAAKQDKNNKYQQAAKRTRDFLIEELWDGKNLYRALTSAGISGNGNLEDYAYVARGLLAWHTLSSQKSQDLKVLKSITRQAWLRFYSDKGWRAAENTGIPTAINETIVPDGPMPSPSALLIDVTLKLNTQYKDKSMMAFANQALELGHDRLKTETFWYGTQVGVLSLIKR